MPTCYVTMRDGDNNFRQRSFLLVLIQNIKICCKSHLKLTKLLLDLALGSFYLDPGHSLLNQEESLTVVVLSSKSIFHYQQHF